MRSLSLHIDSVVSMCLCLCVPGMYVFFADEKLMYWYLRRDLSKAYNYTRRIL